MKTFERTETYARVDPISASPSKNETLKTVVPFLKKIEYRAHGSPEDIARESRLELCSRLPVAGFGAACRRACLVPAGASAAKMKPARSSAGSSGSSTPRAGRPGRSRPCTGPGRRPSCGRALGRQPRAHAPRPRPHADRQHRQGVQRRDRPAARPGRPARPRRHDRERLPDLPAAWAAVTVRQMLNHTSGVPGLHASPTASSSRTRPIRSGFVSADEIIDWVAPGPRLHARLALRVLQHRQHHRRADRRAGTGQAYGDLLQSVFDRRAAGRRASRPGAPAAAAVHPRLRTDAEPPDDLTSSSARAARGRPGADRLDAARPRPLHPRRSRPASSSAPPSSASR